MLVLAIHLLTCSFLTGLIWTVQVVHYPSFRFVGPSEFSSLHRFHVRAITWVVMPLMLLEAATAIILPFSPSPLPNWAAWSNIALLFPIWLITALWSVPCHSKLEQTFDLETHRSLLRSNAFRTAFWSIRCLLLFTLAFQPSIKGEIL